MQRRVPTAGGGLPDHRRVGFSLERFGSWQAPLLSVAALYVVAAVLWLGIDPGERIVIAGAATTPRQPAFTP